MVARHNKSDRDVLPDRRDHANALRRLARPRELSALIALTVAYWFFASNGLQWANVVGAGSPIWPAAGVAFAGLALGGARLWPAIFLGRVIAAITIHSSNPPLVVVAISAGNALAYVVPILLLRRVGHVDLRLATVRDVLWIIGAIALSAIIEAILGVAALAMGDALPPAGPLATWIDWAYGNFAGGIAVAPLLLAWTCNSLRDFDRWAFGHLLLCLAFVAALSGVVFLADESTVLWRTWHIFPALVWAALAFQVRGASAALIIASMIAVWGISQGTGPFIPYLRDVGGSAELLIQQFVGLTGSTILILAAAADERRAKEALRNSAAELQRQKFELETLYREAPVGMALVGQDRRFLRINETMAKINDIAVEETLGHTVREALPQLADQLEPLYEGVFATGKPVTEAQVSGVTAKDPRRTHHWIVSYYPVMNDGSVQAVSCVAQDITERKEAEDREHLLAREVDHRAKNLLAVIQGMVQLARASSTAAFKSAIIGRIQALGRAHSLLAASRWEGVDFKQLVEEEMTPFSSARNPRVHIDGPVLYLRPAAAQSLALVLHELATNAAKYGALSSQGGQVDIAWAVNGDEKRRLMLSWRENGGPPATAPTHQGFGSTLIRSSIERQLKGSVTLDWRPEGLTCKLTIPAEQLVLVSSAHVPAAAAQSIGEGKAADVKDGRVLVLEDEAVVAMQIEKALTAAGCTVVGPATRVDEALDLVQQGMIDAALLDINLAGKHSFPIADLLTAKHVPFAFCTGYEAALTVPERFQGTLILAKPFSTADLVDVIKRLLSGISDHAPNAAVIG